MVVNGEFTKIKIRKVRFGYDGRWMVTLLNGYDHAIFRTWDAAMYYATSVEERRRYAT